jgi:hypothetical protein
MTTITTTDLANVAYAAGATHVADWYDMQFGIDHVSRYFSGSSRVVERDDKDHDVIVQIDGTQGARGDVTRRIMVVAGDTEALERSGDMPGSSVAHSSPRPTRLIGVRHDDHHVHRPR